MGQPAATIGIASAFVPFRDTLAGHATLRYAADCSHRLGVPLHVQYLASQQGTDGVEDCRVRARVVEVLGNRPSIVSYTLEGDRYGGLPRAALVVDAALARRRVDAWVVAPQMEHSVQSRGDGPMCIPLGNDESGSYASLVGIPIARALGVPVRFYHTTWKNSAVASADPREHMAADAREVLATAERRADVQRVPYRTVVEMADGVAEGVIRAALRERCCAIITARGRGTGRGSYVDQLIDESPIPVWTAPRAVAL